MLGSASRRLRRGTPEPRPASRSLWDRLFSSSPSRISPEVFSPASTRSRCTSTSLPRSVPLTHAWLPCSPAPTRFSVGWHRARWVDFTRHSARTAEGRRALSAWRQMRRLLSFTRAKRRALEPLLGRHRDSRMLIFTADNETAYTIAREHLVMPLTCDIGRPERDDVLGRFRRGDIRTLVSARVLNEGLDVPDADVAVIVGGALGEREHVQRVGRLLRPSEGKRAVVYELVTRNTIEVGQARRRRQGLVTRRSAQL